MDLSRQANGSDDAKLEDTVEARVCLLPFEEVEARQALKTSDAEDASV